MKQFISYIDLQSIVEPIVLEKESCEMEYKSAAGGFPQSFWETYSSFANTNGGTIVLGVKELNSNFYLDGLTKEQAEKYLSDFFNMLHNREKISFPLLQDRDVQIVKSGEAYFLVFYVPRAGRSLRPIYCGRDPYTGTFRRDSDGDYHCAPEEVRSMFADADVSSSADGKILKNYTISDLDSVTIRQYRQLFRLSNPDHVWNVLSDEDFLWKINVFRRNRETGEFGMTLAGLLMFGTYGSLSDGVPNFFPDYQEVDDENRWINRICPDGNWESNLFQFYRKVLPILQGFLPKPFVLDGNQRIDETAAHIAVREAFTNALVHADYLQNSSLNVYKFRTKIVFSNPGTMLISTDQYYRGGESVCRNRYLQTMFSFLGSAEKAGSGSDKIIHGWESLNWAKPYIEERHRPNKVVLIMKMESLLDDEVKTILESKFGVEIYLLPRFQLLTLAAVATEEYVSNESLRQILGIHKADISSMLHIMCEKHFLESQGHGRGTIYKLYSATQTDGSATLMDGSATQSDGGAILAEGSATQSDGSATIEFPSPGETRMSLQKRQQMLLDFCEEWRSIEEISNYMRLDKAYIRNKIIPSLKENLEKLYGVPRHPNQRYRRIKRQ